MSFRRANDAIVVVVWFQAETPVNDRVGRSEGFLPIGEFHADGSGRITAIGDGAAYDIEEVFREDNHNRRRCSL